MANSLLLSVLAVALLASSASASRFMDSFIDTVDAPSQDTVVMLVYNQVWYMFWPLIAGPLSIVLKYVFDEVTQDTDVDGTTYSFYLGELLGFAGIGNFDIFFDTMAGIAYKFGVSQLEGFGLYSTAPTWTQTEEDLGNNLGLAELLGMTVQP